MVRPSGRFQNSYINASTGTAIRPIFYGRGSTQFLAVGQFEKIGFEAPIDKADGLWLILK